MNEQEQFGDAVNLSKLRYFKYEKPEYMKCADERLFKRKFIEPNTTTYKFVDDDLLDDNDEENWSDDDEGED